MCAERAVLASFDTDSELCDVIKKSECGICVPPDDADNLVNAIIKLRDDREICRRYGLNGRKYVLENLTKEIGCSALTELIRELAFEK